MGSPLGPLMAHTFLCSTEEKLEHDNKLPDFYRRYVNDMPAINFTMELASDNKLPMSVLKYLRKVTNWKPVFTGSQQILDYYSIIKAMSIKGTRNRSSKPCFPPVIHMGVTECDHLTFTGLKYPENLINSTISHFVTSMMTEDPSCQLNYLSRKILFTEWYCHLKIKSRPM